MKIAFWTSGQGNSGVTSNLACISIASAMEYSYKSVLIENHYQKNRLGSMLKYQWRTNLEKDYQFKKVGIDYIIQQFENNRYEEDMVKGTHSTDQEPAKIIEEASLEILDHTLYYIPVNYLYNQQTFDYNLYHNIKDIMEATENFADITFIDTSSQNNLSSKIILNEVDLVVVNLVQNPNMIQYFFDNYSSILSKCVFLISNYNKKSSLNLNKISKIHSINKFMIAAIPYNIEYQEAVSRGTVVEFIARNYKCSRRNPNYFFMREVKKATAMIMMAASNISKKEESL